MAIQSHRVTAQAVVVATGVHPVGKDNLLVATFVLALITPRPHGPGRAVIASVAVLFVTPKSSG